MSSWEAAHKWALKQFTRLVPHGAHFYEHLVTRHLSQLLFGVNDAPIQKPEPLRHCHCDGDPCPHNTHVHVQMPGLLDEDEQGALRVGDLRSVEKVVVAEQDDLFQRALKALMGQVNEVAWETATVPEVVYMAKTMTLKWHNEHGVMEFMEVFSWV